MLLEDNTRLVKIFLHIMLKEQIHRFRARLTDPLKHLKLSHEDFRNHALWQDCERAIEDMLETTSAKRASRHLVPANNKRFARLAAFRIIADRLAKGVGLEPAALDPKITEAAEQLFGTKLPLGDSHGH
jgi:polyphosphate kinase 2 (PPK2 family)